MGALRDFVADVLETEGAALEQVEPDGLEVLAPEPLRAAMGWPELARLGFSAELPSGAMPVGLESDWLDRFGDLFDERGYWGERMLSLSGAAVGPSDPERLLDRALDLPNATWRLRGVSPAWARCLLLTFRFTAVSDEKREGLARLAFNQSTGAVIDDILARLRARLDPDAEWLTPDAEARAAAGPPFDASMLEARVRPLLDHHVRREIAPFVQSMRRRLDRDRARIHEYHDDLQLTAQRKLAALAGGSGEKADADRKRETLRIAAIEREYTAKLADLRHNYALRVTVDWVQGLELYVPVHRFEVLIKRRKGERLLHLDWHPSIRLLETPVSDWGLALERTRLVCDDRLHVTDTGGQAPCPSCGKAFCRACHPAACPRCGQAVTPPTG
jgi:hypothetical protein